jgi:arylsulfatase A-like enzyme/alpha-L-fucosidase
MPVDTPTHAKKEEDMRKASYLTAGLLALAVLSSGCAEQHEGQAPEQSSRPNIIVVMTDDQGYGDLGRHGNPIVRTPVIDQLASESHRFTDFHVDPTCSPTRSALMSGQYSLRAGVWHTVMGRHMLSDRHHTLPEALGEAGYNTAMIGKWHLGDNYPFRPQDQGFDHVLLHGGGGVGQAPDFWGNTQFDDTYFLNGETREYPGFVTDVWFDEAIEYVRANANQEQPFFLYLSTNAPHVPWRAPEEDIAPYHELGLTDDMARFYGMITNLDDNMGRLRAVMREEGIEDDTIFIFMTDNGSSLAAKSDGEPANWLSEEARAAIGEEIATLNSHMREGKGSTYEGGHRVPFFISWPAGDLGEAVDISDLAAHVDVLPTLLDLAGIDTSGLDTDGISLVPALKDGVDLPDRTLVVTNQRVLHPDPDRPYSVMQGSWRYVHAEQGGGVELFDLASDPGQTNNVIGQHPERAAEMAAAYEAWWQHATGAGTPTTRPVVGTPAENPMRISGMDWLAPDTGQVPWWPGFGDDKWGKGWLGNEENFRISPWAVKVAEQGLYRLTIYLHDEPAQKVIPRRFAHLRLDGATHTNELAEGSVSSTFEIPLHAGDLDIRAWFDDQPDHGGMDSGLAAFYIYIERLPTPDYLVAHFALGELEKKAKYGFEGSGIPGSPEMIELTAQFREMNRSEAKQRGRERFNANKYGMFVHWGLYSSLGGVWKGETMEEGGEGPAVAEWIMRRKEIPRAEYAELAKDFNPQNFDADEWVAVAKAAGMKYMVVGSKHHEGFALFDSDVSDFNIVDATPFERDVIKELEEAAERAGIAFGVYYSNSLDWRDGGDGGLKDHAPAENPRRAPFPNTWDPAPVTFDDYVADKALPQVHELLENYDLEQIWFDTPAYIPAKYSMAFYKAVYDSNPEILVNSRVGNGFGDIGIPGDNVIPDEASENTWEGIATTNNSWGFKSYDHDWKSPLETLFWLVANVSKGGNFLLNVGPDGQGQIPPESVANLLAVGDWLKVNGDAIYDSRPWKIDHEGPTDIRMKGTKHREDNAAEMAFESSDFWFTRKGDKVYVIALARSEDGHISIQSLHGTGVTDIRLLGSSGQVSWEEGAESVDMQLPAFEDEGIGYVLEVTLALEGDA